MQGLSALSWTPLEVLARLGLALGVGLWVSFDRGWPGREARSQTFGLFALLGGLSGLLGTEFSLVGFGVMGALTVLLNLQALRTGRAVKLTTGAGLLVTFLMGALAGLGHRVIPVVLALATVVLLSSKERSSALRTLLSAAEIRAAILFGVLALAIYPVLPDYPIDRFGLFAPRSVWLTVLLISSVGFGNFLLWRLLGSRSPALGSFLGGLVNSTRVVAELSARAGAGTIGLERAHRGILFAWTAMLLRNLVLLGLFQPEVMLVAGAPLILMGIVALTSALRRRDDDPQGQEESALTLESPFAIKSALLPGAVYLLLQVLTSLAHGKLGAVGFYALCLAGGAVSSASAGAVAATLFANGAVASSVAGVGAILASLASLGASLVLIQRIAPARALGRRVALAGVTMQVLGLVAAFAATLLGTSLNAMP